MLSGEKVDLETRSTKEIQKQCSCGIKYSRLPEGTVILDGLFWFNCACCSTLVVKI